MFMVKILPLFTSAALPSVWNKVLEILMLMTGSEMYLIQVQCKGTETVFLCVFVMDKVAVGQFFPQVLAFFLF
jgi:hypothetical protein